MPAEIKKQIALEIAHVLFIDIVGYSKFSINEQQAAIDELTQVVRGTKQFQKAEASDRLIKIPTGDGMALVFYTSPEAPVRCAIELSRALKDHPRLRLRMGIHSGPVSGVIDVTGRANLAGAGLNFAQRVMNCGDAGHILLSKHVAEDLAEFEEWRPLLHELGACEVKHGVEVAIVNLYGNGIGNPELPVALRLIKQRQARRRSMAIAAGLIAVAAIIAGAFWFARTRATLTLGGPEKSIAVLPFENLNHDQENAFFTDGMQDDVLTDLAKIADLKVISRSSVREYKPEASRNLPQIARTLGVRNILEGSVRRAQGRVRVSAHLVDAITGNHLWAETYDRDLREIFKIQSELAQAIADQLRAKLSPAEKAAIERQPTTDLKAYDLYSEAKELLTEWIGSKDAKQSIIKAVALLNQTTERDPNFALAYCQAAYAHVNIYFYFVDHTSIHLELAKQAVDSAMKLAPNVGETHLAAARYQYFALHNFDGARQELAKALETLPNDADAILMASYIDRRQGRWDDALRKMRKANALDPRNFEGIRAIADTLDIVRRDREAVEFLQRQLTLIPESASLDYMETALCYLNAGDLNSASAVLTKMPANYDPNGFGTHYRYRAAMFMRDFNRAKELVRDGPKGLPDSPRGTYLPSHEWFEGEIAYAEGDFAAATTAFANARRDFVAAYTEQPHDAPQLAAFARINARLSLKDEAIAQARHAVEMRPVSSDALGGSWVATSLAAVYAWTDERGRALDELEKLAEMPMGPSYGDLKFNPWWDNLRGDPRFKKIVASLAPK